MIQRRSVGQLKIGSRNSHKSKHCKVHGHTLFSNLLIKSVPCIYISRTCVVSLLSIDLCHIHTEAKVLGPVSLLKPTLIIIDIHILFLANLNR